MKSQEAARKRQLDPSQLYNPQFIEVKKIENLKTLLDLKNQFFIKNLREGITDAKRAPKFSKEERADIQKEQVEMIILALKALYTFGLSEIEQNLDVLKFMSESVLPYLFDENPQIRNEAVQTFSSLQFSERKNPTPRYELQVNKLLHKFFVTAMTDPNIEIRVAMLTKINPDFDPYIARYESLLMLFNCMKDSNNEIKIKTIKILGRLSNINPQ